MYGYYAYLVTCSALLLRAVVTAVASRSKEKAEAFVKNNAGLAGATVFNSYDELLADKTVDAIYLPLPAGLHVEWVRKAAAAGKHGAVRETNITGTQPLTCACVLYIHPGSASALAREGRTRYEGVGLFYPVL